MLILNMGGERGERASSHEIYRYFIKARSTELISKSMYSMSISKFIGLTSRIVLNKPRRHSSFKRASRVALDDEWVLRNSEPRQKSDEQSGRETDREYYRRIVYLLSNFQKTFHLRVRIFIRS